MKLLKRNTATTVLMGPFLDSTDLSAETGLTVSQSAVQVWKEGGTSLNSKNSATSGTHAGAGYYYVPLDTTDTNTLGQLIVTAAIVGTLPVRHDFMVTGTNQWEALFGTSQKLQVDVTQIDGSQNKGTLLGYAVGTMQSGTVFDDSGTYAASTTVFYCDDITEATPDHYIGKVITFRSGNLNYQSTVITDYDFIAATYAKFTVEALTEAPANNDTFVIT